MKRPFLATLVVALIVAAPTAASASTYKILSQLARIERQTRTSRNIDQAKRNAIGDRVRELTQQFYQLPDRHSKETAEFRRLTESIWESLREQSVEPRMRGLPERATPRDEKFERTLAEIEARCRDIPKPVSKFGLIGKSKAEAVLRVRDEVARFVREYPRAMRQYRADVAIVRRYKPGSKPGVYKLEQARRLLEGRALEQLEAAPRESREVLASLATDWLDDAKADLAREAKMKPHMPGMSLDGRLDPILEQEFPDWKPGDPYPLLFKTVPLGSDDPTENIHDRVKRLAQDRHDERVYALGIEINRTLESAWNVARLGEALDQLLGGDPAVWRQTIDEVEKIARVRRFEPVDRLSETSPPRR